MYISDFCPFRAGKRADLYIYTKQLERLKKMYRCEMKKSCMYISDFYQFRMGKRADLYIYTKRFAASKKGRFEVYVDFSPFRMGKRADGPPRGRPPRPTIYTYLHIYISTFHFLGGYYDRLREMYRWALFNHLYTM